MKQWLAGIGFLLLVWAYVSAQQPTNTAQINGVTVTMGNGAAGTGVQRVTIASDSTGQVNAIESGTWTVRHVGNVGGVMDAVTGAAVPANALQIGKTDGTNLLVPYLDPCQRGVKTYDALSFTANTQIITGTSAKKIYFCSIKLTTVAATNVAIVEGTGTVCATGVAKFPGLNASTAATGDQLSANGGYVLGTGGFAIGAETTNADNVCVLVSAANQTSISFSYVVY